MMDCSVEIVDKRYSLCSYINSLQLFPLLSDLPEEAMLQYARNVSKPEPKPATKPKRAA